MSSKGKAVGQVAKSAIARGYTDEEALVIVQLEIVDAKTTLASIKCYRSNLRAAGVDVPTNRELHRRRDALKRRMAA